MPTVRQYNRQVQTTALPSARRTLQSTPQVQIAQQSQRPTSESFGAGFGETLARVGEAALGQQIQMQQQAQAKTDSARLTQVDRQLKDWELDNIHGKTGALTKLGVDAIGLDEQVSGAFDKYADDLRGSLGNDRQREAFDRIRDERRGGIRLTVLRHSDAQVQKLHETEADATVANSMRLAWANIDHPHRVKAELDSARNAKTTYLQSIGASPKVIQAEVDLVTSNTHLGVIERFLAQGRDREAQTYFDVVHANNEINGDKLADVEKALEIGNLRGESQRLTDKIMTKDISLTDAMDEAQKIKEPKLRDEVESRIKGKYAIRKEQEREEREVRTRTAADTIDQIMLQTGNRIDATGVLEKSISPSDWAKLTIAEKSALERFADRKAKGEDDTHLSTWYGLWKQADREPEAFKDVNLDLYRYRLGAQQFMELAKLQTNIRKGNTPEVDKQIDGIRTNSQIIEQALRDAKIDPDDKTNKDRIALLWKKVDQAVLKLQSDTGRKATNDDITAIVDQQLILEGHKEGSAWNYITGKGPFWTVPGTRKFEKEPTATNPKTGEKMVFRNGAWVKP